LYKLKKINLHTVEVDGNWQFDESHVSKKSVWIPLWMDVELIRGETDSVWFIDGNILSTQINIG